MDPSGNDGLLPAISGRRRTFRNRPFDAAPMAFAQGSESARLTCAALPLTSEGRQRIKR
ncbi:transcriptional regulator [Escherichia coli]|nr:transcriptional regulator [Escherichia coli]